MPTSQALSAEKAQVLSRVETALAAGIAQLAERAQALSAAAALPPNPKALDFSRFDQRFTCFTERPQIIEKQLKELDKALLNCEETLREWLTQAETTRRRLATLVGRAV